MQEVLPKQYHIDEHEIDIHSIDKDALYVLQKLHEKGYIAYLVGGGVRDLLQKLQPKDFDISTSAKPEEIKSIFGRRCLLIGRRFRLAHVRFGKKVIEVSTFRAREAEVEGELILTDNVFGSPEEDALRRDFTINGLFYDPQEKLVIDYVGGYPHLKEKTLKCIGDPLIRFKEDPVRMIRLIKFESRFGLHIDPVMLDAVTQLKDEITKSAQARILEELLRMLESGYAAPFFRRMSALGLLAPISLPLAEILEGERSAQVYNFLEAADKIQNHFGRQALERAVLTSCLFYPVLEKKINELDQQSDAPQHLGQIALETNQLIQDAVTQSFSRFPKRLSSIMSIVITNQWRFTPNSSRRYNKKKFLESKDFLQSLKFLKIRSLVDESLKPIYQQWKTRFQTEVKVADKSSHTHHYQHPRSQRRRF